MAIRTKTIEYVFPSHTASLAAATRLTFPSQTLYIPETSSRTFRSVFAEVNLRDNVTAATSLTSWLIGVQLTTASFSDVTITDTIGNSGEQQSFVFVRDLTSYFNSNFGNGSSQICGIALQIGAISCINLSTKLFITYDYDDSSATTRVKTVRIPIESNLGQLTNTLAQVGSTQIPALDTFCPEASKVYRQVWFEMFANEAASAVTDFQLGVRLDAEAEVLRSVIESGLNSACWYKDIWVRNDMTTNATHQFHARTTTTGRMSNFGAILHATYEYNHSTTTNVLNSIIVPFGQEIGFMGSTAVVSGSRSTVPVYIEENNPLLRQSGIVAYFNAPATITVSMSFGNQTGRAYVSTQGGLTCGQNTFVHRIDNNNPVPTLVRGLNNLRYHWFGNVAARASSFDGYTILNYTSSLHSLGDGVHNHTTYWLNKETQADLTEYFTQQSMMNFADSDYFVNSILYNLHGQSLVAAEAFSLESEIRSNESHGDGWKNIGTKLALSDSELAVNNYFFDACNIFKRWSSDPNTERLDPKSLRIYKIGTTTPFWCALTSILTYHGITFNVTGALSGFSGNGTGIPIQVFKSSSHDYLFMTTSSLGSFTGTWFDNTENVYCSAYQDPVRMGRSDNGNGS